MASRKGWSCGVRWFERLGDETTRRLAVILWMDGELVVGADLYEAPDDPLDDLAESFARAVASPMVGEPRRPTMLRADSNEVAKELAPATGLAVEVIDTPEIDEAFASLASHLAQGGVEGPPNPVDALGPVAGKAAIDIAAELLANPPWECLPPDVAIGVGIGELGVRGGRMAVMGHNAECYGFLLFTGGAAFEAFLRIAEAGSAPRREQVPDHLCFEIELLEGEADEAPLPVPVLRAFGPDGFREPSDEEIEILLTAAAGLARFVERRSGSEAFLEALAGGRQLTSRYQIELLDGPVAVRLRLPAD